MAGVAAALAVAAVVVPLIVAGGDAYPSPFGDAGVLAAYVGAHPDALRVTALLQFAASVPLAVLTASVVARLHALGVRAAGAMIALVGGVAAATAAAVSACAQWALSRLPETSGEALPGLVRDVAFAAGGPWYVVGSGLLLAGIAVTAAYYGLLPRVLWITGVALAVVSELATFVFVAPVAAYLIPVGRFGGLAWLVLVAVRLPRDRHGSRR
ncbi:DUF4386 domain-containing protein [Blastococcus litoris]|uniref:DUF4386 domain-containing protein n=1 Tax=Blastococcus litoris TaxID=2171622 RepID=UPI0019D1B781|nr:DUF4386 domain-containing protein [Blastococcus litoris]